MINDIEMVRIKVNPPKSAAVVFYATQIIFERWPERAFTPKLVDSGAMSNLHPGTSRHVRFTPQSGHFGRRICGLSGAGRIIVVLLEDVGWDTVSFS
jgi:hypothetical protein